MPRGSGIWRAPRGWQAHTSATRDALVLAGACFGIWLAIEETETCTAFFRFVTDNPELELDSLILAGILSAVGTMIFAVRRWREAANAERRATELALHDALTGLANRRGFVQALDARIKAHDSVDFACLLVDLDNFKHINDVHGHQIGDRLLQCLSERLAPLAKQGVLIARLGGDEFAVLCPMAFADQDLGFANSILRAAGEQFHIDGLNLNISASVGVSRYPKDAADSHSLIRKADIALYRAKSDGKGRVCGFMADMDEAIRQRALLSGALRQAIAAGEIEPHYQPLVDLETGHLVGFEVLSRWRSATLGDVAPDAFIPIAVEAGLISDLCYGVLHKACVAAAAWEEPLRIAFNIAPRQLLDAELPLRIMSILTQSGLPARRLEIEITEDALIEDTDTARACVESLKNLGVTLSLDDFGTGYSSLHHLGSLPFDKIKIDRSFVGDMTTCAKSQSMVRAIVGLGKALNIPVLAEGVESQAQADMLCSMGCGFGQGWLFGHASAEAAFGQDEGAERPAERRAAQG